MADIVNEILQEVDENIKERIYELEHIFEDVEDKEERLTMIKVRKGIESGELKNDVLKYRFVSDEERIYRSEMRLTLDEKAVQIFSHFVKEYKVLELLANDATALKAYIHIIRNFTKRTENQEYIAEQFKKERAYE